MVDPLVSIMMPCYNERVLLPWALSSVLAQHHQRWELVLVDDGSTDGSSEVAESVGDPRVRVIRLPTNRGRGAARQIALNAARGDFVCMLDADDWMYPTRITSELRVFERHPSLTLVSAGMAIVDPNNVIQGVRGTGDGTVQGPFQGVMVPVAHAPSMYRTEHLAGVRFDDRRDAVEDVDFIIRLLQGRCFAVLPDVQYVYAELGSVSARSAAEGHRRLRRTMGKYVRSYPGDVARSFASSIGKQLVYQTASTIGLSESLIQRRSRQPAARERAEFAAARETVAAVVAETFGLAAGQDWKPAE